MSGNPETCSKLLQINTENVFKIFECNELVAILFCSCYPKPCKHEIIIEEVATKIFELYPDPGRVVFGKTCYYDKWAEYYGTSKDDYYPFGFKPSVRLFINGRLATKSFFDDITVSNILSYIQNLLDNCIQEISRTCIPKNPSGAYEKIFIGYFKNRNSPEYQIFKKLSMVLMKDCQFYAGFGEEYCTAYPDSDHNKCLIIFKISNQPSPEFEQEIFSGDPLDYDSLYNWGIKKCLYTTSEITFDNAEEIQKNRPLSIILFYNPDNLKPVKQFKNNILNYCPEHINFLTANGARFSKKLHEIEKSQTDLPFLLLVRFGIIYQFPENYNVTGIMAFHHLDILIKNFFSSYDKKHDRNAYIYPAYRFDLFCEFPNKSVKINRNNNPAESADDNFFFSLFDE